jgi:hypothetical protein
MMSSESICLSSLRTESYACGGLLNLLIHFIFILAHLLSCYGLLVKIHSYFVSLGMLMVYNYSNTGLYAL